ncbi:Hypothetical protein SRAE_X000025200 [Strongyloides ratti]|uniref:Uncharacterized protein n=1 Tax=Strongyloides ratti TaxID=34506 RepID=A0A090LRU5_STRRB|nr:Hypothetical protein SRAE_X000025200 [Strongyloides ratti]CEF70922.1 Hypothetical protein SRAE_X000025200 [Strongyloides ratti]
MYLFGETIFSSCPHESNCRLTTILALIALFFQVLVAIILLREWKATKSSYTRFLAVVRTIHIFYNLLGLVIGEFRTFFPRKTVICYGIIRYLGDYACGVTFCGQISFICIESFSIVYAFNGQYNIMCRKVGFHDNTLWQKFSFAIFAVNSFTIFITLNYALISRNEAIDLWYVFDEKLKEYLKTHYAILAFGGSKQYMLFIFLTFIMIIFINIGFVIGEFRTFLPRKTMICYGVVRFIGDYACGFSVCIFISFICVETFSIVYAFNGQYNIMCRKVGFHENNCIQKFSFIILAANSLTVFITLSFALIPRNEAINLCHNCLSFLHGHGRHFCHRGGFFHHDPWFHDFYFPPRNIIIRKNYEPIGPCLNKLCPDNYTCFKDECYSDEIFSRILSRRRFIYIP